MWRVGRSSALAAAVLLGSAASLCAQQPRVRARVTVIVHAQGAMVAGASVRSGAASSLTGDDGRAVLRLRPGHRRVVVRRIGLSADTLRVDLAGRDTTLQATLVPVAEKIAPLVVSAARVPRRIVNEPERVEVLGQEDVQEKSVTRPGNLTDALVEMGGVRVQSMSPGLGGAGVRMRGLPGRYSLVLTDGLPLLGGHPAGFGLAQVPPLDLQHVEVIKGAASAFYGPWALGGVVDLISKRPGHERQVMVNGTTQDGQDALLWLSEKLDPHWGYTLMAGLHRQDPEAPGGGDWADVPGYHRIEARPRLFWNNGKGGTLLLTAGGTVENRRGGTLPGASVPGGGAFPLGLDTRRYDAGGIGQLPLRDGLSLGLRTSATAENTTRDFGGQRERDARRTAMAELSLQDSVRAATLLAGAGLLYDGFHSDPYGAFDYDYTTVSAFAQATVTPVRRLAFTASARVDHHNRFGTFFSPRLSALYHLGGGWSARASAGGGFSVPTALAGEIDEVGLSHVQPNAALGVERGRSASLDIGGSVGPVRLSATAFSGEIRHPLLVQELPGGGHELRPINGASPLRTRGLEAYAVYHRDPFDVTATYSLTRATEPDPESGLRVAVPLDPRSAGGVDVAWESDSGARVAIEVYRTGLQRIENDPYRTWSTPYTTVDLLLEKRMGSALLFINGDDVTNVRQTGYDPLLRPSPGPGGRWTTEQWAPLDGRVVNAGVRVAF